MFGFSNFVLYLWVITIMYSVRLTVVVVGLLNVGEKFLYYNIKFTVLLYSNVGVQC